MRVDSGKFDTLFKKVDDLHQLVQNPREQVVDVEAFLGLTSILLSSVKSQSSEGVTPADFVSRLILEFGQSNRRHNNNDDEEEEDNPVSIKWDKIGRVVCPIFVKCIGFTTMVGPMNTELKQRKVVVQRKRTKPAEKAQPEEVDDTGVEEKTDTGRNMKTCDENAVMKATGLRRCKRRLKMREKDFLSAAFVLCAFDDFV